MRLLSAALLSFMMAGCDMNGWADKNVSSQEITENNDKKAADVEQLLSRSIGREYKPLLDRITKMKVEYFEVSNRDKNLAIMLPRSSDKLTDDNIGLVYRIHVGPSFKGKYDIAYLLFVDREGKALFAEKAYDYIAL